MGYNYYSISGGGIKKKTCFQNSKILTVVKEGAGGESKEAFQPAASLSSLQTNSCIHLPLTRAEPSVDASNSRFDANARVALRD